jgi:hypothetical protein
VSLIFRQYPRDQANGGRRREPHDLGDGGAPLDPRGAGRSTRFRGELDFRWDPGDAGNCEVPSWISAWIQATQGTARCRHPAIGANLGGARWRGVEK